MYPGCSKTHSIPSGKQAASCIRIGETAFAVDEAIVGIGIVATVQDALLGCNSVRLFRR